MHVNDLFLELMDVTQTVKLTLAFQSSILRIEK